MIFYFFDLFCQAHIELQEGLTGVQKQTLEGLQEATVKMITQQAEAVQHTADAAKHIKEVIVMLLTWGGNRLKPQNALEKTVI